MSLNQILYGPPGTGKTYNTINKALEIISENIEGKNREDIKTIFNKKIKEGQIVFTTFHQSMSYEDFIEGLKPLKPQKEDEFVKYNFVPGILKRLCETIRNNEEITSQSPDITIIHNFDDLYSNFLRKLQSIIDNLDEGEIYYFESRKSRVKLLGVFKDEIVTEGENASSKENISKDKLKRIYDNYVNIESIRHIYADLRKLGTDISWTTNYYAVFKALKNFEESTKATDEEQNTISRKNYVLIIDEINRGNVSQIFGELITLIEEDKRTGMAEGLEIILPYSKETFSVPPNLYIIGTMNTADRSVEALDTALRRRFSFEEMPPNPDLIKSEGLLKDANGILDGVDLVKLLEIINNRLEKLLDKDHLIGHSYFMNIKTIKELELVFRHKVIPLLQEYFYGDYGKIGLVLGNGFVRKIEWNGENLFADFDYENKSDFDDREVFELHCDDFKTALKLLMEKKQK